jgi:hypothetical protein
VLKKAFAPQQAGYWQHLAKRSADIERVRADLKHHRMNPYVLIAADASPHLLRTGFHFDAKRQRDAFGEQTVRRT